MMSGAARLLRQAILERIQGGASQSRALREALAERIGGMPAKLQWAHRYDDLVNLYAGSHSLGASKLDEAVDILGEANGNAIRNSLAKGEKSGEFRIMDAEDYRGMHGAPDRESGAPIHNVTLNGIYPEDFYSPSALQYYGTGHEADAYALNKILGMRDRPESLVKVWRAIPWAGPRPRSSLGSTYLNPGDWVTISRQYAQDHGAGALNDEYALVAANVRAKDLFTSGDSFLEWGWVPESPIPQA